MSRVLSLQTRAWWPSINQAVGFEALDSLTESARCVKVWVMALGGEQVRRRVELVGSALIRITPLTACTRCTMCKARKHTDESGMTAEALAALAALTASSLPSLLTNPSTLSCNRPQPYRAATRHCLSLQQILLFNKAPLWSGGAGACSLMSCTCHRPLHG